MPVPVQKLLVRPNPWIEGCIDHLGRPAGRVHVDPQHGHVTYATFVGCKFVDVVETTPEQSIKVGKKEIPTAPARHDHRIAYSKEAVALPNTGYYRDALKRGDLFPEDEATARAAGIAKFIPADEALVAARKNAIAHFNANTGDDAHAEMHEMFGGGEPLWLATEDEQAATDKVAAKMPAASAKGAAPVSVTTTDKTTDPKGGV